MLLWRPLRSHYKFHELRSDLLRRSRVIAWRSAASPVRYSILSQHLSRRSMNAINSCNFSTTSTPSETDLQNLSTNVSPKHTEKNKESLIAIYRRIWRDYIFKSGEYLNNCQFLAIASCFIASKTIDAQSGFILKDIVNRISGIHTDPAIYSNIKSLIFLYGAIRIGASLLYNVGNFLTSLKSLKAYEGVTKQSFLSVLLSPFLFHTSKKTGTIIRSIERGTSGINSLVQLSIASILPTIYQISLVMGMVFFELGSIHALTILATTVLYSLFTCIMTHFRLKIRRKVIHHDNSASAYLTDTLINFEAVKIFQNSHFESQSHIKHIKNVVKWSKLQSLTLSALNAGQTAIFASGFTFCQYLTLNHILSGTLTVGDLVLINTLMWQLYSPLFYMGMLYRETSRSLVDISNLFSTLDDSKSKNISISIDYENNGPSTDRQTEAIKVSKEEFRQQPILLKDISLSYPEKKDVLKNFNFEITPKSKIGIVGLSGSGKTSIIRILYGLIKPSSGSIFLGNRNMNEIDLKSWQNNISIVTQDNFLFNRSMLQNIQYGNLDINQEEIKRIANQLNLGNLIDSLPEGIDSCVGEKGSKLSGGERQRVCIARALVKDSQVLIFDEASSALDALTEHTISKLLIQSDNYSDKTSIFITHRLKTIQNCDVIHLINNCGVLESGTHLQLINKPEGIYKQMWEKQQSDLIQD